MALSVSLAASELSVDPGGFVRTEARIRVDSAQPERVRVRVTGPAAQWSWVVPPELDVEGGAEVVMSVGFRVPRGAEPAAGTLAFEVVATPATGLAGDSGARENVTEAASGVGVPGVLTVTPFQDVSVELDPPDARPTTPTDHQVVVENRGNVPVITTLRGSSDDQGMEVAVGSPAVETLPGQRVRVPVSLRPGKPPLLRDRSLPFTVSAGPTGGAPMSVSGVIDQPARFTPRSAGIMTALGILVLAFGLRLTVLAPDDGPSTSVVAGDTAIGTRTGSSVTTSAAAAGGPDHGECLAAEHRNANVTGRNLEDAQSLPPDFSFFEVAADNCSPVRWNPCEPIHYVINPANAPPSGVADVKEAFRRLGRATGITYVDDGLTDEAGQGNRAYQPDRYPGRWAPILVHWVTNQRPGEVQIVGGGFPTRVGDVYVSGILFLNPDSINNAETRTTVPGGFADKVTIGAIGPEGVTWGRIILHELAHITGLGHVREPSQLMYPETSEQTGPTAFQAGDLAGIELLGKKAGCLETPAPSPQSGRQRGGGGAGSGVGRAP